MGDSEAAWARAELRGLDLGFEPRNVRVQQLLATLAEHPRGTVSAAFVRRAERKAAYRTLENPAIDWRAIAAPMYAACAERCRGLPYVVGIVDGSSFAHTDRSDRHGVGPIGSVKAGGRGIKLMSLLVTDPEGVPLGLGAHELWARAPGRVGDHKARSFEARESHHWVDLPRAFMACLDEQGVSTRLWINDDAEADNGDVLRWACDPRFWVTIRSGQDRLLFARSVDEHDSELLLSRAVEKLPPMGEIAVRLAATLTRSARVARVALHATNVTPRIRDQKTRRNVADVFLAAVLAREIDPPPNVTPIDWLLLTTHPVTTFADVVSVVRTYALRWRIEALHFTCKSGLGNVENAQLQSFGALAKWATLHLSISVRAQNILHRSRQEPELPADQVFDRDEIDAALVLYSTHVRNPPPVGSTPTLAVLVRIIAELGGYTGRSSGGPPGIKTLGRGLERLESAAIVMRLQRREKPPPT